MQTQRSHPHFLYSNSGMTLMELLVATALVGIVMVGTISVDFAIHSMRKTTADSSTLALRTSAAMLDITNNIAQAIGDVSSAQSIGIQIDPTLPATAKTWFCARQALDNNPATPALDNNLRVYTDDTWVCYWKPNVPTDPNIYKCNRTAVLGPGACTTNDPIIGTAACAAGCASYVFTYTLTNNPATRQFFFDVNLTNRAYPLQQVNPAQPMKNPEYQLSLRVVPLGHSSN